jgi:hypothetical protein
MDDLPKISNPKNSRNASPVSKHHFPGKRL